MWGLRLFYFCLGFFNFGIKRGYVSLQSALFSAGVVEHLEGNLRQWILHGIDDQQDVRQRDEEFTLTPAIQPTEARAHFNATLEESANVIAALDPHQLLTVVDPQPSGMARHPTILEAIFRIVGHVELHTGQIILLTKQLTATDLDLSIPRKRGTRFPKLSGRASIK